jgi:hydrogenase maturation protease
VTKVRLIALGTEMACDDGAALDAARRFLGRREVEVILAGRPGAGLLELLDPSVPTVLLDVVRLGAAEGSIVEIPLADVPEASIDGRPISSHGFGVAQALRLGRTLGRALPRGIFLGIGGLRFDPGTERTVAVENGIEALVSATESALAALRSENGS